MSRSTRLVGSGTIKVAVCFVGGLLLPAFAFATGDDPSARAGGNGVMNDARSWTILNMDCNYYEMGKSDDIMTREAMDWVADGARRAIGAVACGGWTFLASLAALVFAGGVGAATQQALGIPLFSGILTSLVVGFTFTPALYALVVRRFRMNMHCKKGNVDVGNNSK